MSELGTLLPPAQRPFGRYQLLAKLATGGMAEIFLARLGSSPTPVVIKRVLPFLAEDEHFVAMFRDEARVAVQIRHPNVCSVLEVGAVDGVHFMALEYLHGVPLSRVLVRAMRAAEGLPPALVAGIGAQVAAGLEAAHRLTAPDGRALDLVHRDVSPPNLFLTVSGGVKVLDFGVLKARGASQKTRTGTVKGKNAYMSPEQVVGMDAIDRRSDVFSLGICLWEALSGERLFNRDTDFMTFKAIAKGEVPQLGERRPGLPAALVAVVERALSRTPAGRHESAAALGAALAAALAPDAPAGPPEIAAYVQQEFAVELAAREELLGLADLSLPPPA
jgi:serine/threonine-protein kinase